MVVEGGIGGKERQEGEERQGGTKRTRKKNKLFIIMSLIKVSSLAIKHLKRVLRENNAKYIFFGLKSGGCSGFEYVIKPTNKELSKNDEYTKIDDISFHICGKSLIYCMGTEINWEKSVMGEMFVFNNPLSQNTCGCGISFQPKNNI